MMFGKESVFNANKINLEPRILRIERILLPPTLKLRRDKWIDNSFLNHGRARNTRKCLGCEFVIELVNQ